MLFTLLPCVVSSKADSVGGIPYDGKLNLIFLVIHGAVSGVCYCGTEYCFSFS